MPRLDEVRTSLEVGFPNAILPEHFAAYRGKANRAIPLMAEFPYEDAQFEVVLMDGAAVSRASIREAHRVLKPSGHLFFIVPEKTRRQAGLSVPDVYSLIRDGFDIVDVERPAWWRFGVGGRMLTISARKKTWKTYKGLAHDGTLPFGFRSRS